MSNVHPIAPHVPPAEVTSVILPGWKRAIDLMGCALGLIVLAPVGLLIWIVTRFGAPGPLFFRQERVGLGGRIFTMYKFRTMKVGASHASHKEHIQAAIKAGRPLAKLDATGDNRLIPCGRFLRATGLDELPQIINVFRREMSLVGPRPCVIYESELFTPEQSRRFDVLPGITGLWQVSGKNALTLEEMICLDLMYAADLRPSVDFRILARTIPTVLHQALGLARSRFGGAEPASALLAADEADVQDPKRKAVIARNARRQFAQYYTALDFSAERGPHRSRSSRRGTA